MQKKNNTIPIIIIAGLFFIFGFVTWINSALIPFMKTINDLTESQSYLVASASYISFVVMALPSSFLLGKIGYKKGMSLGLIIMGIGALVFIPAAESRTYWLFLIGIFIQGAGITLIQTAANPYITILGPIESGAKRIAIMGIANKVAGILGSLIFGSLLLSGITETKEKLKTVSISEKETLLNGMADSVVLPYVIMAVVLFILGVFITKSPLKEIEISQEEVITENKTFKTSIFQFPHIWLGMLTLFFYVGAEVIAGDTIISYGISLGFTGEKAKLFTSYTLTAMIITYALGIFLIPKYLKQKTALTGSAIIGIVFSVCIIVFSGKISVLFVALLGIANALVWPAVFPLSLEGLGKFTKQGSALLIMGIAGGAIIPLFYGHLVDVSAAELASNGVTEQVAKAQSANSSYWILIPCYAFILFFAVKGHKLKKN